MNVKSETTPPPCLICKQVMGNWAGMKVHLAVARVLYRPHQCTQCDYNSPDEDAMCKHTMETKHEVRINEHYDFYKHRCLGRLLNDHLKRASPEGGRIDAVVARVVSASLPADVLPEPAAVAVVRATVDEKKEEERGEGSDGVKTEHQAGEGEKKAVGGTNATRRIPRNGGKVAKPAIKTVTCRYQGCGVAVNVNSLGRHIETAHVKSIRCPVQQCGEGGAGRNQGYCRLETLTKHINKTHGGPDSLSSEDKKRLDAVAKKVKEGVVKLRQQCYPGKIFRKRGGTNKAGGAKRGKK